MNRTNCYQVEALEDIAGLREGDPRLTHLADCPRCRARLAQYRSFMAAEAPPGADPDDAQRRLAEVVAVSGQAQANDGRTGGRGGLLSWLSLPALRPALALAVVLVVALGIWRVADLAGPREGAERVLRGEGPRQGEAFEPMAVGALPGGRVRLSWRAVEGADSYVVVLHAGDLAETARLDPVTGTELDLDPGRLEAHGAGRQPVSWTVVALSGGDPIARSLAAPLAPSR